MLATLRRFLSNEEGATAIEYGLIAALIGVVIISTVGTVGQNLDTTFGKVSTGLAGGDAGGGDTGN